MFSPADELHPDTVGGRLGGPDDPEGGSTVRSRDEPAGGFHSTAFVILLNQFL